MRNKSILWCIAGLLISVSTLFPKVIYGKQVNAQSKKPEIFTFIYDLKELEHLAWVGNDSSLAKIEKQLIHLLQEDPKSMMVQYILSHVYLRRFGNEPNNYHLLKNASQLAEKNMNLQPESELGYLAMADILDALGFKNKAQKLFESSLAIIQKPTWRTHLLYWRISSDETSPAQNLAKLGEILGENEVQEELLLPYVITNLRQLYTGTELLDQLEVWNKKFPNHFFSQELSLHLTLDKKYKEAHEINQRLYQKDPLHNPEAIINDAILSYRYFHDSKQATILLEQATKVLAQNPNQELQSLLKIHQGGINLYLKKYPEAQKNFAEALKSSTSVDSLLTFIASLYEDSANYKELMQLTSYLKLEMPGIASVYSLEGDVLSQQLNKQDQAVKNFENAHVLDPGESSYVVSEGLAYYRLNEYKKALEFFEQAIVLNPQDSLAQYNKACSLALLGLNVEALNSLKQALTLNPSLQKDALNDDDFKNLKSNPVFQKMLVDTNLSDRRK